MKDLLIKIKMRRAKKGGRGKMSKKFKCGKCKKSIEKSDAFVCSSCHIMTYCSNECANADWVGIGGTHADDHDDNTENIMDLVLGSGKKGEGTIFLGSVDALSDSVALDHIDSVVSALGENYDNETIREAVNTGREPNNQRFHLRITLWDAKDQDIAYYFDPVADWMHDQMIAKRHLLIHCVAGHSRSTTLLLYYMLKYAGFKSVDEALSYVQVRRPTAQPNSGFMKQLRQNPGKMSKEYLGEK